MKSKLLWVNCLVFLLIFPFIEVLSGTPYKMTYTVSMEKPSAHYFQIRFDYETDGEAATDFTLPVWAPGYYMIQDFSKYLFNFKASDENGQALPWQKITKNTWRVKHNKIRKIVLNYDIYAFKHSIVDCYLDDEKAFISPVAAFLHVKGKINRPVRLNIVLPIHFKTISTGLANFNNQKAEFYASDFDELYDCPIMIGNHREIEFEVKGLKHCFAIDDQSNYNYDKLTSDLRSIIETATSLIGEIPYKKYYFLNLGFGRGGLEHRNSMTVSTGLPDMNNKSAYQRWLNFITHEYFHLYNVKTIRPINLGPFDYSAENYTHMLWVSEGFTVYYEYLIMNRAGLMTRTEFFNYLTENIKNYEDIPASRFQSATQSSFDTWIQFFNFGENSVNTKISYYDKGCALGMLLDLKIRNCSKNAKSLDDVMKFLYFTYHKEKKRGFTDMEFRQVCEKMAGCSLSEIFEVYACTTAPVDYTAYLDYAGLLIDTTSKTNPGAYIGIGTRKEENKTIISQVLWNSPAWHANLSAADEIVSLNNVPVSNGNFENQLLDILPGQAITLQIIRNGKENIIDVQTSPKIEKSFRISEKQSISDFQKQIRESWLK